MQPTGEDAPASVSDLVLFLDSLTKEGRAMVSSRPLRAEGLSPLLQQWDAAAREELALDVPDYSPVTANWAVRLFYQLCQFVVSFPARNPAAPSPTGRPTCFSGISPVCSNWPGT